MKKLILILMFLVLINFVNAYYEHLVICGNPFYENRTNEEGIQYQVLTYNRCDVLIGGGGGGSGGGSAGTTAENPVTVKTGESVDAGTLSEYETYVVMEKNSIITFTAVYDSYLIKIEKIMENYVIFVDNQNFRRRINTGFSSQLDLNNDGLNDIEINLISITNERANLYLKKIKINVPEGTEQKLTTPPEGKSKNWLWIILIEVIIISIIWYLGRKK